MNNPDPTKAQLRTEAGADRLLAEQTAATAAFKTALDTFAAAFDAMRFPLGSPVAGYDVQDINGVIADWMTLRHDCVDAANDAAREAA